VWSDTGERYKDARIIFSDTQRSNWTWDSLAKQYYWHRFFSNQPDLNNENPTVVEDVLKVMRYWLDMGVDALRLDAIPYLVEREGSTCENLPETHDVIKTLPREIDVGYSNRMLLAEANQWPSNVRPYFGDGDECHMAFHFPLMPRIYMALRQEDRLPITGIIIQPPEIPETCQWGVFLRNHDELTLEMVTNDERDYMYLAYSADPRMRVNLGIRRRLAPLVDNNRRRIELLNSLLLSFPGTPILYYGDEIGMGDNICLGDRNGVRTPMQWNADRNAGLSTANPAQLYSPVIMDPVWGYETVNVEAQHGDPIFAPELDAQHDRSPKTVWSFRPRKHEVLRSSEPQSAHLHETVARRTGPVRRESFPLRTVGRSRLVGSRRHHSGRGARVRRISAHRAPALSAHIGALQFPVARTSAEAPASGGKYEFRRRGTLERNRRLARHVRRGDLRAPRDRQFS